MVKHANFPFIGLEGSTASTSRFTKSSQDGSNFNIILKHQSCHLGLGTYDTSDENERGSNETM